MKKALKAVRGAAAAAGIAVLVQGVGALTLGPLADATDGNVTATTAVHVRTSPTTQSQSLAVIYKGHTLPAHGSENGWTTVTYNGKTAYVASAYLAGSSAEVKSSSGGSTGTVYTTANLNMRTGPSTSHRSAFVAQRGTAVVLTGEVSGEFAQVKVNGGTYWASTRYLSTTAAAAYHELPTPVGKMRGTTALMIRTTSTSSFVNLGDAPRGTIFNVTGKLENGMSQVIWQGRLRWVNAKYLVAVDATASAPAPAPTTALPSTTVRYATTLLNNWAASTGTRYSGEFPRGSELNVTGKVENGRAQIVHNGAIRWVTAKYVSATKPTDSTASSGSSTTLNRGYSSGLDLTNANVQAIVRDVWDRYPAITTMYGWRRDVTPDHPAGRAVDVMIPSYSSNQALGWEIANYYRANASKYNINYIIFAQKIWSVQRNSEGWRWMSDRGSDNANHYNHVHINTYG